MKNLSYKNLSTIRTHNTEELKEDLIRNGLIKQIFKEYFNFEEIDEETPKEKQIDLDHFLNG